MIVNSKCNANNGSSINDNSTRIPAGPGRSPGPSTSRRRRPHRFGNNSNNNDNDNEHSSIIH